MRTDARISHVVVVAEGNSRLDWRGDRKLSRLPDSRSKKDVDAQISL